MNINELSAKWGNYTNVRKLVDDISLLLGANNHRWSELGICAMLDTYFTKKEPLIKLLHKSKNYLGDMRISIPTEIERGISRNEVYVALENMQKSRNIFKSVIRSKDESGKTVFDYLKTGKTHFDASEIEEISITSDQIRKFTSGGYTTESRKTYDNFYDATSYFQNIRHSQITLAEAADIARYCDGKFAAGLKTSRAFNKLCCKLGVDKASDYNKLFAIYSDTVSPGMREINYIISVNPYDYLTMSIGRNWTSCHNIRTGAWKAGTLSYMLDSSSIITYVVDREDDPRTSTKIYRNMMHYNDYTFVQSRIYPQENDGATNLYDAFRSIFCKEMTELLGLESNEWTVEQGTRACRNSTVSIGAHYKDYTCNENCNVFFPKEIRSTAATVEIGATSICPNCGNTHTHTGRISCC